MIPSPANTIRQTIHHRLGLEQYTCVFPTETAARFWADDYVRKSPTGVLRLDKVMAWDRFKALFLPVLEQQPANAIIRGLFALDLLKSDEQSVSLQWFHYPNFPEASENLSGAVARLLPRLEELQSLRMKRPEVYGRLPIAFRNDVERINMAYRHFLKEHNLFEPQFLNPSVDHVGPRQQGQRYAIFFPDVCTGWEEFSRMDPFPDWVEIHRFDASATDSTIGLYSNELMEMKALLDKIEQLLDKGSRLQDIMVTVGDTGHWRPYLTHEAAIRDIPLNIVEGLSPLAYAPGRFLKAIAEVHSHRFSLTSMKGFLLDPRYPFKNRTLLRSVIERGLQYAIVMGSTGHGDDSWISSLSQHAQQNDGQLLQWYVTFKRLISAVMQSSTIASLLKGIFAFQEFMLEEGSWDILGKQSEDTTDASIYAFCVDYLRQIQKNLQACGMDSYKRLFPLYLQFLERQRYIPKDRNEGIPVYGYTVSVGMCCEHHYLLGCTEEATRLQQEGLPLIPESVWKDDDAKELTEDFLEHYRIAGEHVSWSCAQSGFSGTSSLAPAWFIDHDAVDIRSYQSSDANYLERMAWSGKPDARWNVRCQQQRWFAQAQKTAYVPPRYDLAEKKPTFSLWHRLVQANGALRVSSTNLDAFVDCPMKWASRYLFSVEKGDYEMQSIDHRRVGIILHEILEGFFREVTNLTHVYRADMAEAYKEILLRLVEKEFSVYADSPRAPAKTTLHYLQERYTQQLLAIVQAEAKQFEDFVSEAFEQKLEQTYPQSSYTLEGRVDRIMVCTHDDGSKTVAVVDYKKSLSGRKSDYDDFSEAIPSHQLPIYAKLIHDTADNPNEEKVVGVAAFYDIGKGSYRVIWKDGEDEKREGMISLVESKIEQMVQSLQEGHLGTTDSLEPCTRCDYRQICRRRYALI